MDGYKIYKQGKLTFILIPEKIIVRTSLGQQFYLLPTAHYWQRRLRTIRLMIELGEVRDLNELAAWSNPGISWEHTSRKLDFQQEEAYI